MAVAAEQDNEGSAAVGKSDRKRASKEEAQNPKKSRSAVAKDDEVEAKDDEVEDVFAFF